MVLEMPWNSLSTMEKLSSLIECLVVWEWSWEGDPEMSLVPVPKVSTSFPYLFHCIYWVVTLVPIADTSLAENAVPLLRSYQ